ncbi:MAG: hypothetical protein ACTTIO_03215 [Candidatus Fimenecus sp.]
MKNKNRLKISLNYIAAVCYLIAAIICFTRKEQRTMGIIFFSLFTVFISLGAAYAKDNNKNSKDGE